MNKGVGIGGGPLPTAANEAAEAIDDSLLIRRVAEQDRRAFELLYRAYYPRLFGYLFRLLRRVELVEETLNEVMLVVWLRSAEFEGRSRVSTWIFGIAYRQALKSLRRAGRQPQLVVPVPAGGGDPAVGGPAEVEWSLAVSEALEQLSSEHRAVVELTYYYGYSYREIATIVGCPTNTVKTRMFHARRQLRRLLADTATGREEES